MYKTEINICLGSSCFARGNKKLVTMIKSFLKEYNLEEKVNFHGSHCFGMCEKGPILKIEDKTFENVSSLTINEILYSNLEL